MPGSGEGGTGDKLSLSGGSGDSIREFSGWGVLAELEGGGAFLENGFSSSKVSSREGRLIVVLLLVECLVEVGGCLFEGGGGGLRRDVLVGALTLVFVMFPTREVFVL